jgi:photosystem II stability/assembly factor-like uncharacterized protein
MVLLVGTDSGVYRAEGRPFDRDDVERVLDCGWATSMRQFDHTDGVFVTSTTGVYRTRDGGETWADLGVPRGDRYWYDGKSEVWSVLATSDGVLYAGTNDPYLFRSVDDGETWSECKGFRDLPSRGHWESPLDPHYARLRVLETVPGRPETLIAGIEAGGYHVSHDGGRTWTDHRETLTDDIHQILPLSADVWLAATGYLDHHLQDLGLGHAVGLGGLHRTTDGGESWNRLDVGNEFGYVRRVFGHDGRLYFSGGREAPTAWVEDHHEIALFESTNFGRTFERVGHPGDPDELVETWAVDNGTVLCGSGLLDAPDPRADVDGRIMARIDDAEYRTIGRVPGNVSGLEVVG